MGEVVGRDLAGFEGVIDAFTTNRVDEASGFADEKDVTTVSGGGGEIDTEGIAFDGGGGGGIGEHLLEDGELEEVFHDGAW